MCVCSFFFTYAVRVTTDPVVNRPDVMAVEANRNVVVVGTREVLLSCTNRDD